jgi:hypothetical protein
MVPEQGGETDDVAEEDLRRVAQTLVFQPDVDASAADRFFGQVQVLSEDRAQRGWPGEGSEALAVFVRTKYPREAAAAVGGASPSADMIGTDEPLLGRISGSMDFPDARSITWA